MYNPHINIIYIYIYNIWVVEFIGDFQGNIFFQVNYKTSISASPSGPRIDWLDHLEDGNPDHGLAVSPGQRTVWAPKVSHHFNGGDKPVEVSWKC